MAAFTRANAWNHGGTFKNDNLLWYAKGVGAMQAKKLDDTGSWWFFAAMHGEYLSRHKFPGWGSLSGVPHVPTTPLPSKKVQDQYWDQCQHQSWYFLPWHRGYLLALEAHIRDEVKNLKGPKTWALPYWNYFGPGSEFKIPPAFLEQKLPDGSPNPLLVTARHGPDNDGNIFVPTRAKFPSSGTDAVSEDALSNDLFTGTDDRTLPPGFGGPQTGFSHEGDTSGNLENDPHNMVHSYVGGSHGLMSDPGIAALDPIFYLHHANIDRIWARWHQGTTNLDPTEKSWLHGPASAGDREFVMPMPGNKAWVYTPQDVTNLGKLDYTYDSLPPPPVQVSHLAERLTRLGKPAPTIAARPDTVSTGKHVELVGASQAALLIKGSRAHTTVKLDVDVRSKVSRSLSMASATNVPDRVLLSLENVRGTHDGSVLNVYVNLPEGAKPADRPELLAGSVALFGLRRASDPDARHGGRGLNFTLDITKNVDALHLSGALESNSVDVTIVPRHPVPDEDEVTVGRVSIYRQGH